MRLWHYKLIQYLPKAQLVSQWRECICIAKSIHDTGSPNHILVNAIMDYDISEFIEYCHIVKNEMEDRGYKISKSANDKLAKYIGEYTGQHTENLFRKWHDISYLRVCMANLFEKYYYAKGKSTIDQYDYMRLENGYQRLTGDEFYI